MASEEKSRRIPEAVFGRIPRYYRYLRELIGADVLRTSSTDIGRALGISPSQIRQDLSRFGDFGQQGYGYNVKDLYSRLSAIIGVNRNLDAVMIGAGRIARALAENPVFQMRGIHMRGIFAAPGECGQSGDGIDGFAVLPYESLSGYLRQHGADIAVLCTSKQDALRVCDDLPALGIGAVWNFSGEDLREIEAKGIIVRSINLSDSLLSLCCELNNTGPAQRKGERE